MILAIQKHTRNSRSFSRDSQSDSRDSKSFPRDLPAFIRESPPGIPFGKRTRDNPSHTLASSGYPRNTKAILVILARFLAILNPILAIHQHLLVIPRHSRDSQSDSRDSPLLTFNTSIHHLNSPVEFNDSSHPT